MFLFCLMQGRFQHHFFVGVVVLLCFALFDAREIPTHNVFYFVLFCSLSKTNECCLIMD